MRAILAAFLGCVVGGCSPLVAVPAKPVDLTCKAANGAVVRLNLDLAAHRFQKEGFPVLPIESVTGDHIVLLHVKTRTFEATATIDRDTMSYIAKSKDLGTYRKSETRYACTAGAPFDVDQGN